MPSFVELWISHIFRTMPDNVKYSLVAIRTVFVELFAEIFFERNDNLRQMFAFYDFRQAISYI
nr:hypothetical protein [Tolypothrix sp. NIES-4075]